MILLVQKSENCCHLDVHPKSQPRNVLKMFLVFQEIEPIVLINVFLYKKRSVFVNYVRKILPGFGWRIDSEGPPFGLSPSVK